MEQVEQVRFPHHEESYEFLGGFHDFDLFASRASGFCAARYGLGTDEFIHDSYMMASRDAGHEPLAEARRRAWHQCVIPVPPITIFTGGPDTDLSKCEGEGEGAYVEFPENGKHVSNALKQVIAIHQYPLCSGLSIITFSEALVNALFYYVIHNLRKPEAIKIVVPNGEHKGEWRLDPMDDTFVLPSTLKFVQPIWPWWSLP